MATDIFESRLSCFEREAAMLVAGLTPRGCSKEIQYKMYNSFIDEIYQLDSLGLCDEINVYSRGENINKQPVLRYSKGDKSYKDFNEALISIRAKQRKEIFDNATDYILRIGNAQKVISEYGINEVLTSNAIEGLKELEKDFLSELTKEELSK